MGLIDTLVRCVMRRIGLIVIMLLFVLTGCQEVKKGSALIELGSKIEDYLAESNQFDIKTTMNISINNHGHMTKSNDQVNIQIQREPYYAILKNSSDVIVETIRHDEIIRYSYDTFNQVEGIQLYEMNKFYNDPDDTLVNLFDVTFSDVDVNKVSNEHFEINGKMGDYLPQDIKQDFSSVLIEAGLTGEEINNANLENVYLFDADTFSYKITMDMVVREILIKISMALVFNYTTFETIDFTDDTKFYPMNSNGTDIPIDANKPILFRHTMPYDATYYTYLEPGRYGFESNGYDESDLTISVSDSTRDKEALMVFKDIYNKDVDNPSNISHLFDINEAGYYFIDVHYPMSYGTYQLELINIEPITDGLNQTDLIVSESGTYDYELESKYDFFAVNFDLPSDAVIYISSNEDTQLYRKDNEHDFYESIPISDTPIKYVSLDDSSLYIHDLNYQGQGSITFDIKPFIHSRSLDEPLLAMKDYPNEDYLYSGSGYPYQYVELEVTEAAQYTFHFDVLEKEVYPPTFGLYDNQHQLLDKAYNGIEILLTPGVYYVRTNNRTYAQYSIYYTKDTSHIAYYNVDTIEEISVIDGSNQTEMPQIVLSFDEPGMVIVSFELTEPKEIVFSSNYYQWLCDASGKRISLHEINPPYGYDPYVNNIYYNYLLESGKYYIVVRDGLWLDINSGLYKVIVRLGIFTGGEVDDSKHGDYPTIPFGETGLVMTYDYQNDIDGVTFTLTKTTQVQLFASSNSHLYQGLELIEENFKNRLVTLEAGTYTIISSGYPDDWHIVVKEIGISE